jgi:hypothetical protein
MRRSIILSSLALGALSAVVAPASAEPADAETIPVECDNGESYEVVTNGNGEFTPAHIVGSTGTFVPVAFGEFTGTVRSSTGQVLATFTEEGSAKGKSGKNRDLLECTFSFSEVNDGSDPEFPVGSVFTGSGSVTGFLTPAK